MTNKEELAFAVFFEKNVDIFMAVRAFIYNEEYALEALKNIVNRRDLAFCEGMKLGTTAGLESYCKVLMCEFAKNAKVDALTVKCYYILLVGQCTLRHWDKVEDILNYCFPGQFLKKSQYYETLRDLVYYGHKSTF